MLFLVPPTVTTPNGIRVVTDEGTSLLVNCTATGIPPPNITWQDPSGIELPNDNNNMRIMLLNHTAPQLMAEDGYTFLYHVTRTLMINNVNDTDTGNYTCRADNSVVPVDSDAVEVFVRGMELKICYIIKMYITASQLSTSASKPLKGLLKTLTINCASARNFQPCRVLLA